MIKDWIERIEQTAIAYLLATMTIVTFSQVVARYLFNTGAVWALELTVFLFAWLILFGMSYGVKQGFHIGVDAFVRMLPERSHRALSLLVGAICIGYGVILLIGATEYWLKIYKIGIEAIDLPIPRWIPYMILPLGLALLIYRVIEACIAILKGERKSIAASHEAEEMVADAREQLEASGTDTDPSQGSGGNAGPERP